MGKLQRRLPRDYDIFDPVYTVRLSWEWWWEAFQAKGTAYERALWVEGSFQQLRAASKLNDI